MSIALIVLTALFICAVVYVSATTSSSGTVMDLSLLEWIFRVGGFFVLYLIGIVITLIANR